MGHGVGEEVGAAAEDASGLRQLFPGEDHNASASNASRDHMDGAPPEPESKFTGR